MEKFILFDQEIVQRFALFMKNNQLGHAYLFAGPKKLGKVETAKEVAKLVNCEKLEKLKTCGVCHSCVKISIGSHPDIYLIDQLGESIKIEDIRNLLNRIQLRSFEAKRKVFIINRVERMTLESANALLKTLEEPNRGNLFILITSAPDDIPGTIKSRCQKVNFFPLSLKNLRKKIIDSGFCEKEKAHFLAYSSEGCLGKFTEKELQEILEEKNRAIDEFVFSSNSEHYLKDIAQDKQKIKEAVRSLIFYFKDLLFLKQQVFDEHLTHLDRIKDLTKIKEKYSICQIDRILKDLVEVFKSVDKNLNVKIPLSLLKENLWIR